MKTEQKREKKLPTQLIDNMEKGRYDCFIQNRISAKVGEYNCNVHKKIVFFSKESLLYGYLSE